MKECTKEPGVPRGFAVLHKVNSDDFLSFTAVARDFRASRYDPARGGRESKAPEERKSHAPPHVSYSVGSFRFSLPRRRRLRQRIGSRLPPSLTAYWETLKDRQHIDETATGLTLDVNKKIRQSLLKQHGLTNRFTGTPLSKHAESEYHAFVSHYSLKKVQRRLVVFAIMLALATLYDALVADRSATFIMLRTVLPVCFLLGGAVLLSFKESRLWWRLVVMCICVFGYVSILGADGVSSVIFWSSCDKDYNTMWQLMWLLLVMQCSSLFFSLDLVHVATVLLCQWATFVVGSILLYRRWWLDSDQGEWRWPHGLLISKPSMDKILEEASILWSHNLTLLDEATEQKHSWPGLEDQIEGDTSSRFIVDAMLIATGALLLLLLAVRRMNRFERQCFVNTFVLLNKVSTQVRQIRGQHIELLALFSNPRVAPNSPIQLRPLQLGQELKHLLRAVPHVHIAVEPAAGLADVQAAVRRHDPRIILFSGHSFMGSLAFELPNGRIDLPPPDLFIKQLERPSAARLQCVFLNGCATAELAFKLVTQLPYLSAICWCSITEDAAARSFAQGFYDAVGSYIAGGEPVQVSLAYWAGLSRMYAEGFRLGDPSLYLHGRGHPHWTAPDFKSCPGCCPPVHGVVVLLSNRDGQVHALMPDLGVGEKSVSEARGGISRTSTITETLFKRAGASFRPSPRLSHLSRPSSTDCVGGRPPTRSSLAESISEHLLNLSSSSSSNVPSSWLPITEKDLKAGGKLARQLAGNEPRRNGSPHVSCSFFKSSSKSFKASLFTPQHLSAAATPTAPMTPPSTSPNRLSAARHSSTDAVEHAVAVCAASEAVATLSSGLNPPSSTLGATLSTRPASLSPLVPPPPTTLTPTPSCKSLVATGETESSAVEDGAPTQCTHLCVCIDAHVDCSSAAPEQPQPPQRQSSVSEAASAATVLSQDIA